MRPAFARTIGIDYSGAETPTASLKGLRAYLAQGDRLPVEVPPPPNEGVTGNGAARRGDTRWRRLTEQCAGGAKSVFHFDAPGSVAKSTHAGIPWLRFIRRRLAGRVHFWPFDGWEIPAGRSAIAEVHPALCSPGSVHEGRTADQHDACSIAAWLSRTDRDGSLAALLNPDLSPADRTLAQVEGWILGVANATRRPGAGARQKKTRRSSRQRNGAARYTG